jgi:hypothetical protein
MGSGAFRALPIHDAKDWHGIFGSSDESSSLPKNSADLLVARADRRERPKGSEQHKTRQCLDGQS